MKEYIRFSTKEVSIAAIVERIKNKSIIIYPEFRNTGINTFWNKTKQSKIIESIIIDIPIADFYVDATDNDKWILIDGANRLNAIYEFITNDNFYLENLDFLLEYNNINFINLHRNIRRKIEETSLNFHLLQPGLSIEIKDKIYKRIRN